MLYSCSLMLLELQTIWKPMHWDSQWAHATRCGWFAIADGPVLRQLFWEREQGVQKTSGSKLGIFNGRRCSTTHCLRIARGVGGTWGRASTLVQSHSWCSGGAWDAWDCCVMITTTLLAEIFCFAILHKEGDWLFRYQTSCGCFSL